MPHETAKHLTDMPAGLISMICSLFGIGLLIAWGKTFTRREQILALGSGLATAAFLPAFLIPWLLHTVSPDTLDWLPSASLLYGVSGFLSGALGIKVIAAVFAFGDKLPKLGEKAANRIGGE